jgi:hypothetical protein
VYRERLEAIIELKESVRDEDKKEEARLKNLASARVNTYVRSD